MVHHFVRLAACTSALTSAVAFASPARASDIPRALVADFVNASKDSHAIIAQSAASAVAVDLAHRNLFEVVPEREVARAAQALGLRPPYRDSDWERIARETAATMLVTGEVHNVETHDRGGQIEVEVGIIVRVRDLALGDLVNGAAEKAILTVPANAGRFPTELAIDAASQAASRAVDRIQSYQPVTGTIMNSIGSGALMLNRGMGQGVKPKQEFIVYRDGQRVGRVRAGRISAAYTELAVIENRGGINFQDRATAVFPEPKFR